MELAPKIEAILFYKAEPVSLSWLTKILEVKLEEIEVALISLESDLTARGLQLVRHNENVALGTASATSDLISKITQEELSKDLGRAGLETLTIVLYRAPIARSEIDYIRGVNSSFILRNLMIRGLVERKPNPNDSRSFVYQPTLDLLAHLGLTRIEELPNFDKVQAEIKQFFTDKEKNDD
ncbi:MAG: hypothetical protein A2589_01210 [Candidatus Vogelbacteria bacterium RIFOXYD1_FULL_46_19]|uniref:SMC-Scp complex subunit ScpB n=1 Tax=Candidatus Vogelbacteria bacterium RIFOXYD1_FULL_46_19 TaxID=1802439 RepID=A0A1G2QFS8_9BACT|nr:MAG: hypothetical protein A2589_01210 [Candidatus Vogelbacteria bacterium RIFOXYD1_FULL_46_19]